MNQLISNLKSCYRSAISDENLKRKKDKIFTITMSPQFTYRLKLNSRIGNINN